MNWIKVKLICRTFSGIYSGVFFGAGALNGEEMYLLRNIRLPAGADCLPEISQVESSHIHSCLPQSDPGTPGLYCGVGL